MLDTNWNPKLIAEYAIILPLLSGTFVDLIHSEVGPPERVEFFAQLLDGIAFLHSEGLCHRDIKPANIGIHTYNPPNCKLIDFGCASLFDRILYDRPGTVIYLAPEQIPDAYHGREVDLWSSGIVGAQLLGWQHNSRLETGDTLQQFRQWLECRGSNSIAAVALTLVVEDAVKRKPAFAAACVLRDPSPIIESDLEVRSARGMKRKRTK